MSLPNRAMHIFPPKVRLHGLENNKVVPSEKLVELLIISRESYDWPSGTGTKVSQQYVIDLKSGCETLIKKLNNGNAQEIISSVSKWGGNNANSQRQIDSAIIDYQKKMYTYINKLVNTDETQSSLNDLSSLPGLRLVMATKVYRFCSPNNGAALDRHSSYFFNSLPKVDNSTNKEFATNFKREWSTGKHTTSRLAIYQQSSHNYNLNVYIKEYLPLLRYIASYLNKEGITYRCAATNLAKLWCPADIEMASYFWWAKKGAR